MSDSIRKVKIKLPKSIIAQCRDRANAEGISVSVLVEQAIAQYLISPLDPKSETLSTSSVSPAEYARLVARVERIEAQLTFGAIASSARSASSGEDSSTYSAADDEDLQDLDEPDEILYDFLEAPRSPTS